MTWCWRSRRSSSICEGDSQLDGGILGEDVFEVIHTSSLGNG